MHLTQHNQKCQEVRDDPTPTPRKALIFVQCKLGNPSQNKRHTFTSFLSLGVRFRSLLHGEHVERISQNSLKEVVIMWRLRSSSLLEDWSGRDYIYTTEVKAISVNGKADVLERFVPNYSYDQCKSGTYVFILQLGCCYIVWSATILNSE